MSFTVIIPVRLESSRLPGKPLLDIVGKPLIRHVYERAQESAAGRIIIATDSQRIADVAAGFGAEVCMTAGTHRSGTERVAEVAAGLGGNVDPVVVNLQGDEPQIPGRIINQVADLLKDPAGAQAATLCEPITEARELLDSNVVKVVMDADGYALYFSRASIPWRRDALADNAASDDPIQMPPYFRHLGIYAYTAEFLAKIPTLPECPLEQAERLEQLRLLFRGYRIRVGEALVPAGIGVDTADDLLRARALFAGP